MTPAPPPSTPDRRQVRLRTVIVEDETMIRQMLAMCLEQHADLELVGQAATFEIAQSLLEQHAPEAMILDLGLAGKSGLSLALHALNKLPNIRILAVTATRDGAAVRQALDSGIVGFVSKGESFEILQTALTHLARGEPYYSPVALKLLRSNLSTPSPVVNSLTPREREVLCESARGFSVKEIASNLQISENTVKTHRKNLLQKLAVHDVVALTHFAVRNGLVSI